MARIDNEVRITPSVLDRLIDYEPDVSREPAASRSKTLRLMKQGLKRDLECLLNTRQWAEDVSADLAEISSSLAVYGLPDLTGLSARSSGDQARLRRAIETAVRLFEPRLQDISVTLEPINVADRALHFKIEGSLRVEPAPEPVVFDTVFSLTSNAYIVREE